MSDMNSYSLEICGIRRNVSNFEYIKQCVPNLTVDKYLSMLFTNLGYNKRPKDLQWLIDGRSVESLKPSELTNKFDCNTDDFPPIVMRDGAMFMNDVLDIIYTWLRGNEESGVCIDPIGSFKFPNREEMVYRMKNSIKIERTLCLNKSASIWDSTDILTRRLYNLNPAVNKYYHKYCIENFEDYIKHTIIEDAKSWFVAAFVDPDIIMSIIRNDEIMAAFDVSEQLYHGNTEIRTDYEVYKKFVEYLDKSCNNLHQMFVEEGILGILKLCNMSKEATKSNEKTAINVTPNANGGIPLEQLQLEQRKADIKNLKLDQETKKDIFKYVDKKSIFKVISKDEDRELRLNPTLRRLYSIIDSMKQMEEESDSLDNRDKLILSMSLYIDPNDFALYDKRNDIFYVADSELNVYKLDHTNVVQFYKDHFGKDVQLMADEVRQNMVSKESKNIIIPDAKPDSDIYYNGDNDK